MRDAQEVSLPVGATLLTVQPQGPDDALSLWALVEPAEKRRSAWRFWIVGTGHSFPAYTDDLVYVATVQQRGGMLVWHVFAERGQ